MDQPKLDRLLRLMKMLTGNTTYPIIELANRLETTERTIYRYIETFRDAGFVIKKQGSIYRIDKSSPYFKDISQLVHFTEEEAYILKSAIENIDENNLIKQNLKKKLYTVYDYKILAETTVKGKNAVNVNRIIEAIHDKKQVLLRNYSSANSHVVRDRLIEPFAFTTNYIQLWAFEPESGKNKLFKLSRVLEVVIQADSWQHEIQHHAGYLDCFRISSHQQLRVQLRLGLRAATLLAEEYPLAEKDLARITDNHWTFDTKVCSYEGIGRFVIGLLHDIEIVDSPDFEAFVNERLESYRKNKNDK
jgi:predicted DNA-binding transcriptional regulator YafY